MQAIKRSSGRGALESVSSANIGIVLVNPYPLREGRPLARRKQLIVLEHAITRRGTGLFEHRFIHLAAAGFRR